MQVQLENDRAMDLRQLVVLDDRCKMLFQQALALSNGITENAHGKYQLAPFFTDHSRAHFEAVERILNTILFGGGAQSANSFVPNPEEALYLLAATWVHDIGMWYGIFDGETSLGFESNWDRIRDEHELRTTRHLQERWDINCDWTREERILLSTICRFHRRRHSLDTLKPTRFRSPTGCMLRIRELAALLRLADACHIDSSRSPLDLRAAFLAMGMPVVSRQHWALPLQVSRVEFDHASMTIQPLFLLPAPKRFGTVVVDFSSAADTVVRELSSELRSVQPYLEQYSNAAFRSVEKNVTQSEDVHDTHNLLLSIWPLLLKHVASPSEAACLIAVLVMRCVAGKAMASRAQLEEILATATGLHPFDVLLQKLAREVRTTMHGDNFVDAVTVLKCKEEYLSRRARACRLVGRAAAKILREDDVLIVGAYSHNVMHFLRENRRVHRGPIIVVRTEEPTASTSAPWERMQKELETARMDYATVALASLPTVLVQRHTPDTRQVFVMGCYGIIDGESVLAQVGSLAVARIVHSLGGSVLVLAETEKIASGDELSLGLHELLKTSVRAVNTTDQYNTTTTLLEATVDLLPRDLWDEIIGASETVSLLEEPEEV